MHLVEAPTKRSPFEKIIGNSGVLREILSPLETAASSPLEPEILIDGEAGTGAEEVAKAIHASSPRAKGPLLAVDCSALSEGSTASDFFGRAKSADAASPEGEEGLFQSARNGTLYLGKIGELSRKGQTALLHTLREHSFTPMGSEIPEPVCFRLVTATPNDLREKVAAGLFDRELYDKIGTVRVRLPPLRERAEEIPELAQGLLQGFAQKAGKTIEGFTSAAMDSLQRHPWSGNRGELEGAIKAAVVFCPNMESIDLKHLPDNLHLPPAKTVQQSPERIQAERLLSIYEKNGQNAKAAAISLDMNQVTFGRRLKWARGIVTQPAAEEAPAPKVDTVRITDADGKIRPLRETEGDIVRAAIELHGGTRKDVADALGISPVSLRSLAGVQKVYHPA